MKINIIGAGLSGLIAGATNPDTVLYEMQPEPLQQHRALLRFRSDRIAKATGIEFRKVIVRKDVVGGATLGSANRYSYKVSGKITDRSIWNLAPTERYIAPENLYEQLINLISRHRIRWNSKVSASIIAEWRVDDVAVISTIPVPFLGAIVGEPLPFTCEYAPIFVYRYRLSNVDVYQTLYYPQLDTPIYRATITSDLLTVEGLEELDEDYVIDKVLGDFGVDGNISVTALQRQGHKQNIGKIVPVDDAARKQYIHHLTAKHGIYSLGRFAVWKNILLDDVYDDMQVIRGLLRAPEYDRSLLRMREGM